jgi:hypothetical protein
MDISELLKEEALELRERAQELAAETTISDKAFVAFAKEFGDLKWLPFELPETYSKEDVLKWQHGEVPPINKRLEFIGEIIERTHPSLL